MTTERVTIWRVPHEAVSALRETLDMRGVPPTMADLRAGAAAVVAALHLPERDQETAELRAEVERLRGDYSRAAKYRDEYRDDAHDASEALLDMIGRLEAAEAKLSDPWDMDGNAAAQAWRRAAEAESARLASVVELHKKALNVALNLVGIHPDLHTKDDREALEGCRMVLDDEPAALASVAPDTATPGEAGCRGEGETCLTHGGGWIFNDDGTADVCESADLYPAASSADDKAGER